MIAANGMDAGGGWFRVANAIVDEHGAHIGPFALAVYLALARHADKAGHCWPSLTRLANLTAMSRGKVIESIRCLEGRGLLSKVRSDDGRGGNIYTLLLVPVGNQLVHQADQTSAPHEPASAPRERGGCTTCTSTSSPGGLEQDILNKTHLTSDPGGEGGGAKKAVEFNAGYYPVEAASARRIVDFYNGEVKTSNFGGHDTAVEVVTKLLLDNPAMPIDDWKVIVRCYAADSNKANRDASRRRSALNFFRDGDWKPFVGREPPPTAEEASAAEESHRRKQADEFKNAKENRAKPAKLEKIKTNGSCT